MEQPSAISGRIVINSSIPAFTGGTAHIYLEDVSYADGRARIMAETTIKNVTHSVPGETNIEFELKVDNVQIDEKADYAVRIWIDAESNGEQSSNDLFSTERLLVLTNGYGNQVTVRLGK